VPVLTSDPVLFLLRFGGTKSFVFKESYERNPKIALGR
jgi:hypothetical protein